jgi:uncharacterized protein (TIGR03084 family)
VPIALEVLAADLEAETRALDDVLAALGDAAWDLPTPAPGWTVRDQVSHLAYFDDATVTAVVDPAAFDQEREVAVPDVDAFTARVAEEHRGMAPAELLEWWRAARVRVTATLVDLHPSARVPWYGPDLSVPTALTARIMETWAHGQDVVDAVGAWRPPTPALRHVAHLGVRTFANSFTTRGLAPPDVAVRVELDAPDGTMWAWGDGAAVDAVRGPVVDFCLLVTQRRHVADTHLAVTGEHARRWMQLAQAFAGPPGEGHAAGQFEGR